MTLTRPPAAPAVTVTQRPAGLESVGLIVARSGFGWRGQRPTTATQIIDAWPGSARPSILQPGASGADQASRPVMLEAELFAAHGLDDVDVREVLG